MKKLLSFIFLSSTALATEIELQNLPKAVINVKTLGTIREVGSDKTGLLDRHKDAQKLAIDELKNYVQLNLSRQVIEAKCETPKGFLTGTQQGVKSTCFVSFL